MRPTQRMVWLGLWILPVMLCLVPFSMGCRGKKPKAKRELTEAERAVIAAFTQGLISRESPIRVLFAEPMGEASALDTPLSPSPFNFDPGIQGVTVWTAPNQIEFRPSEQLPAGQAYAGTLDLKALRKGKATLQLFDFAFSTMKQSFEVAVDGLEAADPADIKRHVLTGKLVTADVEDAVKVEEVLRAEHEKQTLDVAWIHEPDRRTHAFVVQAVLRREATSTLRLSWDGTSLDVDKKETREITVPGLNTFAVDQARPVQGPEQYIELRFTDPLRESQNLSGLVAVDDRDDLRFAISGSVVRIYSVRGWRGNQTVRVAPGIRNALGRRLREGRELTLSFEVLKPQLRFVGKGVIVPSSGGLTLPIETVNLRAVRVEAMRIPAASRHPPGGNHRRHDLRALQAGATPAGPAARAHAGPHLLARIQKTSSSARERWKTGEGSPWVRTTLKKEVQLRAAEILGRHHRVLAENGIYNAAAVVLDVETGHAVAYVGNVGAFRPGSPVGRSSPSSADQGQHVDVIPARRSTGSILKPLLFAAMLEAGEVLPGQLIPDVPTHLGSFHPENFDRAYAGALPAEMALARSLNVPAVRMLRAYGVDRFYSLLRRLGLTTLFRPAQDYGLALILGGAEGSLWDITSVYAGMARTVNGFGSGAARAGTFRPALYVETPADARTAGVASDPPLHAAASYLTLKAMMEVERPGEEQAWRAFETSRRIHTDARGAWRVHADCEPVASIQSRPWFLLPPVIESYYRRRHSDYQPPPPFRPDCRDALGVRGAGSLSFVYPKESAQIYVPVEMNGAIGRVVFEAAHRDQQASIYWHLDDEYYGETRNIHQMAMAPPPGRHVLTLVDANGETVSRSFAALGKAVDSE